MNAKNFFLRVVLILTYVITPISVFAQSADDLNLPKTDALEKFPLASLNNEDQTTGALEYVDNQRAMVAYQHAKAKQACYQRVFVNACLNKVHEAYLIAKYALDDVEVKSKEWQRLNRYQIAKKRREDAAQKRLDEQSATYQKESEALAEFATKQKRFDAKTQEEAEESANRLTNEQENLAEFAAKQKRYEENLKKMQQEAQKEAASIAEFKKKQARAAHKIRGKQQQAKVLEEQNAFDEKQKKAAQHEAQVQNNKEKKAIKNLNQHN